MVLASSRANVIASVLCASCCLLLSVETLANQNHLDRENRAATPIQSLPATVDRYVEAKRLLYDVIFGDRRKTLYCGCPFDASRRPDLAACGYRSQGNAERAARVEVEHVVPASWIGAGRACWRQKLCVDARGRRFKGRKCCLKTDPEFRAAYNDLHNLWPVIGEVNEQRRNYAFAEIPGEPREFGQCDFEVDDRTRTAEPRPAIRGDVARIHLYMEAVHGIGLSRELRARLRRWHRSDPPDEWERARNARIKAIQGLGNPWVEERELARERPVGAEPPPVTQ